MTETILDKIKAYKLEEVAADKAAKTNVIHKNAASRIKVKLANALSKASA